jgi:hypothetical protein
MRLGAARSARRGMIRAVPARRKAIAIVLGLAVVLLGSWLVANVLSAASRERDDAQQLARRGAAQRSGDFEVLRIDQPRPYDPGTRRTVLRVVWRTGRSLPVVQCVLVERKGSALTGFDVRALRISAPIGREASCPAGGSDFPP